MLTAELLPGVPLVESPFFEEDAPALLTAEQLRVAQDLREKGYAVIDFPDRDIDEKIEAIKRDFHDRFDWQAWRDGKLEGLRIQDAWRFDNRVRDIAVNPKILELLSAIYGRQAFPFQTLNFPVGTQQAAHSDHAHFNSIPDRFMCGVWLAFEDVDDRNGPLFYYPGSHKWPSFQNEHLGVPYVDITKGFPEYRRYVALWDALARKQGLKREIFRAAKGQALIWTSNLLHGGSMQLDSNGTRWSQVTHYFFEGCAYTTPVANDTFQGRITYRDVTDIRTGKHVPNMVSGAVVRDGFREAIRAEFRGFEKNVPATRLEVLRAKTAKWYRELRSPHGTVVRDGFREAIETELPGFEIAHATKLEAIRTRIATSRFKHNRTLPRDFDPIAYVKANPDLIDAQVDPFEHYLAHGRAEGRPLR